MSNSIFIYWGSGSLPCWRPLLVMAEKGIAYDEKIIEFSKKEHKSEEVLKINPRGQVPTFKDGDVVINESMAIVNYLESKYKDKGTVLIPSDPKEQALVQQRTYEGLANLQNKFFDNIIYYVWKTKKEDIKQEKLDEAYESARTELVLWEKYLENSDFVAGNSFSMADVIVFTYFAFFWRMGLDLSKYPKIEGYFNRLRERESIKKTWPPHWKTSDNNTTMSPI